MPVSYIGNHEVMPSHQKGHLWESSRGKNDKKELNFLVVIGAAVSRELTYVLNKINLSN